MKNIFITAFMIYILWVVLYLLWERFFRRPGKQCQVLKIPFFENTDDNDIMGKALLTYATHCQKQPNTKIKKTGWKRKIFLPGMLK